MLTSFYKEANICPIHKKDDKSLVNNYQAISLLNAYAKDFEWLIFKHLFNHLQENNILDSYKLVLPLVTLLLTNLPFYIILFAKLMMQIMKWE